VKRAPRMPLESETVIINNLLVEKYDLKNSIRSNALIGCIIESILAEAAQFNS
jgi:hypothetical protein